jgi:hypothetical protein
MRYEQLSVHELTMNYLKGAGIGAPASGKSLWHTCPLPLLVDPSLAHIFYDDFYIQPSTKASAWGDWTVVEDDGKGGTDGVGDAAGGIYTQYCDADDEDESYLISDHESWLFAAGKSMWLECRMAIVEGTANDANWIMGLMDAAGANAIQDAGAGPAASFDGAVFYGLEDTLTYGFGTSNAAVQDLTSNPATTWTMVSGTMMNLGFHFDSKSTADTTGYITPYVNGVPGIRQSITLSGLAEMEFIIGVKSNGTSEEAFQIDYLKIVQVR